MASDAMVTLAPPPVRVADPTGLEPSLKVIEPVAEDGLTAAVRTTACPLFEGLGEELRVVVVGMSAALTTSVIAGDVLEL